MALNGLPVRDGQIRAVDGMIGRDRRIARFFDRDGRAVVVPIDDSLICGPKYGLENLGDTIGKIAAARPNALIGYPGHFEQYGRMLQDMTWVCNLTASTIRSAHTRKRQILSVKQALFLGCDWVAAHVNTTSCFEPEMLQSLADIIADARECGVPVLAIMYPRSERSDGKDENYEDLRASDTDLYAELVSHAVRVAKDLGASAIKTKYTGSLKTFERVVAAAAPVPILVAGGPLCDSISALSIAYDAVQAGASGVCFGRNTFSRPQTQEMIQALRVVVHDRWTPQTASSRWHLEDM
jgi:DhnA family fructose-bisphosphate aldolase class Ia